MKIGIVGSREYSNLDRVKDYIRILPAGTTIISGGARGVDKTAEEAAKEYGLETLIFPALWGAYGARAAYIRNKQIVNAADEIVAFWDGSSKGTRMTIDLAKAANKPVRVFHA